MGMFGGWRKDVVRRLRGRERRGREGEHKGAGEMPEQPVTSTHRVAVTVVQDPLATETGVKDEVVEEVSSSASHNLRTQV